MARVPNLFIIGAPKSGTTSLYVYLKGHPEVFMSEIKEPCYFARDLAQDKSGTFLRFDEDHDRYLELFAEAGTARCVGEASTRYLYSKDAPPLIHAARSDALIVAILRNPVEMIHSLHAHKLAGGTEDLADLEEALAAEADRHAGRRLPPQSNPLLATYRDRAQFGEQLPRWMDVFGRENVHVMIFEDLVAEPEVEFRRLLEFLGVDPTYRPASFTAHNPAHGPRSRLLRTLLRSSPVQWVAYRLLPRVIGWKRTARLARRVALSRLQRRQIDRTQISPDLRRRLEDEFAPDVTRLSQLLGRDLGRLWFGRPVLHGDKQRGALSAPEGNVG